MSDVFSSLRSIGVFFTNEQFDFSKEVITPEDALISSLGEKVDQCVVTFTEKYLLPSDYLCSGIFQVRNDCKLTLMGNVLRTKCVSNSGSLHFDEASVVYPRFLQPSFELIGKADKSGKVRRARLHAETDTVILAESSHGQIVIYDQGSVFNANNNRVKAAGFAKSGRRFLELNRFSCATIEYPVIQ